MVSIGSEQLKFDENGNPIFVKTISYKGETVTLTPEQKNLKKELTFQILFQRVALNPKTMLNLSAWFVQDLLIKIPNKEEYRYYYLYYEKGMNLPCVRILDVNMGKFCGFTTQVTLSDKTYVRKIGSAKRVTEIQAKKMLLDGSVLCVFSEENLSEQHVAPKSE